jgi:hypothetical protein
MTTAERCPTGCGRIVKTNHLLCAACWRGVPRNVQLEVHRTWRRWARDFGNLDLMRAYQAAADAAKGSIR